MHRAFWWAVDRTGSRRPAGLPAPAALPRPVVALVVVPLMLGAGGCAAADGGRAEGPVPSRTTLEGPTGTTGGAGISPEAYRAALAPAVREARAAVDALGGAKGHRDLRDRTLKAGTGATAAAGRLAAIEPPPALAPEHAELIASLGDLAKELAAAAGAVERQELCAASAVLARVTGSAAGGRVRAAAAALAAAGSPDLAGALLPDPVTPTNRRLRDGTVLIDRRRDGLGRLNVDTRGTTRDSVVSLVRGKRVLVSIYVAPGRRHTLTRIPDGSYQLLQAAGTDYDRRLAGFTRDCSFTRFNDTLRFETTSTSATVYSASLRPVEGGNAKLSNVDPDQFPTR